MLTLCTKAPTSLNGIRYQEASEGSLSGSVIIWGHLDIPGGISIDWLLVVPYCVVSVSLVIHLFHEVFAGSVLQPCLALLPSSASGGNPMPSAFLMSPHPSPVC